MRKFMVIEHFREGCWDAVYERYAQQGRMLPTGLHYLNSWRNREKMVCYQLMETESPDLFDVWFERWADLVAFEIVPVE